jgi:hypothetical protein
MNRVRPSCFYASRAVGNSKARTLLLVGFERQNGKCHENMSGSTLVPLTRDSFHQENYD